VQTVTAPQATHQSKKRIFIVLGAVITILLVALITGVFYFQNAVTSPNHPNQDVPQYSLKINQSHQYASSANGTSYYVFTIVANNSGSDLWNFTLSNLKLKSNSSTVYNEVSPAEIPVSFMGNASISAGQCQMGQVAFWVQNGQVPSELDYFDSSSGINLEVNSIPPVSLWASKITGVTLQGFLPELNEHASPESASIVNPEVWYYNGDVISVDVTYIYYFNGAGFGLPLWVHLNSIQGMDGFTVSSLNRYLPITMVRGQILNVNVELTAPASCHFGNLNILEINDMD
jgi:hypothetical protein